MKKGIKCCDYTDLSAAREIYVNKPMAASLCSQKLQTFICKLSTVGQTQVLQIHTASLGHSNEEMRVERREKKVGLHIHKFEPQKHIRVTPLC